MDIYNFFLNFSIVFSIFFIIFGGLYIVGIAVKSLKKNNDYDKDFDETVCDFIDKNCIVRDKNCNIIKTNTHIAIDENGSKQIIIDLID